MGIETEIEGQKIVKVKRKEWRCVEEAKTPKEEIYLTEQSIKELLEGKIIYEDDGRVLIHPPKTDKTDTKIEPLCATCGHAEAEHGKYENKECCCAEFNNPLLAAFIRVEFYEPDNFSVLGHCYECVYFNANALEEAKKLAKTRLEAYLKQDAETPKVEGKMVFVEHAEAGETALVTNEKNEKLAYYYIDESPNAPNGLGLFEGE